MIATDRGGNPAGAAPIRAGFVYAALAAGVATYLFRLIGAFTRYPGKGVDARFNQIVLEHLWDWARGRAGSLADPPFFYPYKDILYFSDSHFGTGWLYAAFRALGASREVAFDLWFLAGMATTFAATLYVFRSFGLSGPAAAVGACLFAFSLPMLAQDAHAQLVYRFGVPLALLSTLRFLQAPNLRDAALTALWVGWQFLCSVYIGVFLVEALVLVVAFRAVAPAALPRARADYSRVPVALVVAAAALCLALTAAMMIRYAETARLYEIKRDMAQFDEMAPRWSSFLTMAGSPTVGWLADALRRPSEYWAWEHQLFPGLGALLLAGVGVSAYRREVQGRRVVWLCLALVAGMVALTLDVGGYGLFRPLAVAPGLNAIRSPGRIALVMALPLGWLAGLGVAACLERPSPTRRLLLIVGLGLALLDLAAFRTAATGISETRARVQAIEAGFDPAALRARRAVLLRFGDRSSQEERMLDIDLMIAAQDMGLSTFNGYSGSYPPLYRAPRNCAEAHDFLARIDRLPYKRAGAENAGARGVIAPFGACGESADASRP